MKNLLTIAKMAVAALTLLPAAGIITATDASAVIHRVIGDQQIPTEWEVMCQKEYVGTPIPGYGDSGVSINYTDLNNTVGFDTEKYDYKVFINIYPENINDIDGKIVVQNNSGYWNDINAAKNWGDNNLQGTLTSDDITALQSEGGNIKAEGKNFKLYDIALIRKEKNNGGGSGDVTGTDKIWTSDFNNALDHTNTNANSHLLHINGSMTNNFAGVTTGCFVKVYSHKTDDSKESNIELSYQANDDNWTWTVVSKNPNPGEVVEYRISSDFLAGLGYHDYNGFHIEGENVTIDKVEIVKPNTGGITNIDVLTSLFRREVYTEAGAPFKYNNNEGSFNIYPQSFRQFSADRLRNGEVLYYELIVSVDVVNLEDAASVKLSTNGTEILNEAIDIEADKNIIDEYSYEFVKRFKIDKDTPDLDNLIASLQEHGLDVTGNNIELLLVRGDEWTNEEIKNGEFLVGEWTMGHPDFGPRVNGRLPYWADMPIGFLGDTDEEKKKNEDKFRENNSQYKDRDFSYNYGHGGNTINDLDLEDGGTYKDEENGVIFTSSQYQITIPAKYFNGSMGYEVEKYSRIEIEFQPWYGNRNSAKDNKDFTDTYKPQIQVSHGNPHIEANRIYTHGDLSGQSVFTLDIASLAGHDQKKNVRRREASAVADKDHYTNEDGSCDCLTNIRENGLVIKGQSVKVDKIRLYGTYNDVTTGVEEIEIEPVVDETVDADAPVEYYNLQGMRVANPAKGMLLIRVQGKKVSKIIY